MGELMSGNTAQNCENCKKEPATHEYVWGMKAFVTCKGCRDMMASNILKDVIKDRTGVLPNEERNQFLDKISEIYKSN